MKYTKKDPELNKFLKKIFKNLRKRVDEETRKLATLSVSEQFIVLNQPSRIDIDHQGYFDILRIGRGSEYSGANWFSWWYGRNMRILVNIIRITDSPSERILVIYGAGHNKLLNQFGKESVFYIVEYSLNYLKNKE